MQNFDISSNGAALEFSTSGSSTIQDIHFHNNESDNDGGAVAVGSSSTVTVDRCKFTSNSTTGSYDYGGALFSEGTLTMQNCLLYDNSVSNYNYNGIVQLQGNSTIMNCTFADNSVVW